MKKVLLCFAVFALLLSFTACSDDKSKNKTSSDVSNIEQSAVVDTENGENRQNETVTEKKSSSASSTEEVTDKGATSSTDDVSSKESSSTTASNDNSGTTSSSAWSDGQRLPDMPIE